METREGVNADDAAAPPAGERHLSYGRTLGGMLASLGAHHVFLPDDQSATDWPDWCRGAGQTTDAHLVSLAAKHQARLATLDTAIPDAFVIPLESRRG